MLIDSSNVEIPTHPGRDLRLLAPVEQTFGLLYRPAAPGRLLTFVAKRKVANLAIYSFLHLGLLSKEEVFGRNVDD
jgi:hypothetical protein